MAARWSKAETRPVGSVCPSANDRRDDMARNLALKKKNNAPEPLSVASAAENVSNELDKVIHERMRLGIISALAANEKLSFSDLKNLLNTTDGNVSVHARKLEDAGYISMKKSFSGRVPLTEYKI